MATPVTSRRKVRGFKIMAVSGLSANRSNPCALGGGAGSARRTIARTDLARPGDSARANGRDRPTPTRDARQLKARRCLVCRLPVVCSKVRDVRRIEVPTGLAGLPRARGPKEWSSGHRNIRPAVALDGEGAQRFDAGVDADRAVASMPQSSRAAGWRERNVPAGVHSRRGRWWRLASLSNALFPRGRPEDHSRAPQEASRSRSSTDGSDPSSCFLEQSAQRTVASASGLMRSTEPEPDANSA
jgi:hypothetical protein